VRNGNGKREAVALYESEEEGCVWMKFGYCDFLWKEYEERCLLRDRGGDIREMMEMENVEIRRMGIWGCDCFDV
jgi:hypothetical protein